MCMTDNSCIQSKKGDNMEKIGVYQLAGDINRTDPMLVACCQNYLGRLGRALDAELRPVEEDVFREQGLPVFFLASGGIAGTFRDVCRCVEGPYILLTTSGWNSLPASMEILAYLHEQGMQGEILHGEPEEVAPRLELLLRLAKARRALRRMRLGVIGETLSLAASRADGLQLRQRFGAQLEMLEVQALIDEYRRGGCPENAFTRELRQSGYDPAELEKALNVYGAVRRMVETHRLDAVTVRCFDLLGAIGTTGCLALAILNAEGIPAGCEGDTRSLLSMAVLHVLTGEAVFMANPSRLDRQRSEMVFAHCTLPMNMPRGYRLTTHFESGIGVALAADFDAGPVTVFKCDETGRFQVQDGELVESLHLPDLCRTQLRIRLPEGVEGFLTNPIANHQMICKGHWAELIRAFFA